MDVKEPIKLSHFLKGVTFEMNSKPEMDQEGEEDYGVFGNENDDEVSDKYKNPCASSFAELRSKMTQISEDVYKNVLKEAPENAKQIDLKRSRVSYHRNFYTEYAEAPFDSTYLNGKPGEICIPIRKEPLLEGVIEAISSMKEGEQAHFVIGYKKMFKALGCPPLIPPKADILCDFKIIKVDEVGDQEIIDQLEEFEVGKFQKFADVKESFEETRTRARHYFDNQNYTEAIKLYRRVNQIAQNTEIANETEKEDRAKVLMKNNTNIAICFNKKEDWNGTLNHIKLIHVEYIDRSPKLLHAKGKALMKLGENEEALKSLEKALQLEPYSKDVIKTIEELTVRMSSYKSFCKDFAKKLNLEQKQSN